MKFKDLDLLESSCNFTKMVFYRHSEARKRNIQNILEPNLKIIDAKIKENDTLIVAELLTPYGRKNI